MKLGHVLQSLACLLTAQSFAGPPAFAEEPPDLAAYDCTRTDGGKAAAADELARQGFQILARARFGNANLMMVEPKTAARANCFLRTPPPK